MRAAIYDRLGAAEEVLRVVELDMPEPASGEVRVRLAYSTVNPTDWKLRSAGPGRSMAFDFQVPHQDGSGVIDKVGDGVDRSRIGQRVWLYLAAYQRQFGTAEEYVCVPSTLAVALGETASFELGASLGVPALTACHALFCDGPIDGQTVLVAGGAGAVGHFAIELAHWRGARVVTTVSSPEKAELARAAGADVVINYRTDDVVSQIRKVAPDGVDRVIEVAPENLDLDLDVVGLNSAIVFYASTATDPALAVRRLMNLNVSLRFMLLYTISPDDVRRAVSQVSSALSEGAMSELPVHCFGLDEIVTAHQLVERGATGKVLLEMPQYSAAH